MTVGEPVHHIPPLGLFVEQDVSLLPLANRIAQLKMPRAPSRQHQYHYICPVEVSFVEFEHIPRMPPVDGLDEGVSPCSLILLPEPIGLRSWGEPFGEDIKPRLLKLVGDLNDLGIGEAADNIYDRCAVYMYTHLDYSSIQYHMTPASLNIWPASSRDSFQVPSLGFCSSAL